MKITGDMQGQRKENEECHYRDVEEPVYDIIFWTGTRVGVGVAWRN